MPGLMVTRGLTGSSTNMIARGFIPTVRNIIKGGSRFAKKVIGDFSETLKISAMLINTNGKELSKPIVSNITKVYKTTSDIVIKAIPKKLIARKAPSPKVTAKLRNINNE